MTVDLGKSEDIAGFSWSTGAGLAQVVFPRSIEVEVSDDGEEWHRVGDLMAQAVSERPLPPPGSYHVYRAYSMKMPCKGRYVRLTATQARYCFCDEIEIYGGGMASLF